MAEKSAVEEGFLVRKLKRKEKKWIVRMSLVLLCVLAVSLYVISVSYTHLDVYKRQLFCHIYLIHIVAPDHFVKSADMIAVRMRCNQHIDLFHL